MNTVEPSTASPAKTGLPKAPLPKATAAPLKGHAPSTQNTLLFRIYVAYRTVLSVVFIVLQTLSATRQLAGAENPALYRAVSIAFLLSNIALLGAMAARMHKSNARLVLLFILDIICITLLSDASGGISSGLPVLLTVSVASGAVLIDNRSLATFVAAFAVLIMLGDTLRLISVDQLDVQALFSSGLLGLLFFAVSGIVQVIVLRLGSVEALALSRAEDLYRLQRLNEQIVQNMQTGILLVDAQARARVMNSAASRLLDSARPIALEQGRPLRDYSAELDDRLTRYRRDNKQDGNPIPIGQDGAELVARFQGLEKNEDTQVLVFLEDYRPVAAYAQSLKLSSLGRLAGSIAHEIRNPLGAISHATQLLQESQTLGEDDRKMLKMVLGNTQRVNDIVESVMRISRREPPKPQQLALKDWMSAYVERYRDTREDPGLLQTEYADPASLVIFDPEHLERVMDNLVDNAVRHSALASGQKRAELRVRVDRVHRECIVDVYDEGSGVAPADIPRLFEPFFTRSHGGAGLGLYLCRELCELNQARLTYAPTSNGRSRFQITIQQQE